MDYKECSGEVIDDVLVAMPTNISFFEMATPSDFRLENFNFSDALPRRADKRLRKFPSQKSRLARVSYRRTGSGRPLHILKLVIIN